MASASPTIYDSVVIASSVRGPIDLNGIKKINGDLLSFHADGLTSISSRTLVEITGRMDLYNLTNISKVSFPSLSILKEISFDRLPRFSNLDFSVEDVSYLHLVDTGLTNFSALASQPSQVLVQHNPFLQKLSFSGVGAFGTSTVSISDNAILMHVRLNFPKSGSFNVTGSITS